MDPFGPEPVSKQQRRPRVLIAEDDDDIRALLVATLRTDGYEVEEARDGREVLERISPMLFEEAGDGPDAIITDVRMPGVSGMTLLAGLRAIGWTTPIIVITAYDIDVSRSEAEFLGADEVIGKPFNVDVLRAALARVLLRSE